MTRIPSKNGFTLIELLLVVTLAALVGMTVYSMFASTVGLNLRLMQTNADEDVDIFYEKIDRELSNMVAYKDIPFEGGPAAIKFAGPIGPDPVNPMNRGIGRIAYAYDGSGKKLTRRQQNAAEIFKAIETAEVVTLNDVHEAVFSYLIYDPTYKVFEWVDEWYSAEHKDQIPAAVKIKIRIEKGGKSDSYERTVQVPIAESTR